MEDNWTVENVNPVFDYLEPIAARGFSQPVGRALRMMTRMSRDGWGCARLTDHITFPLLEAPPTAPDGLQASPSNDQNNLPIHLSLVWAQTFHALIASWVCTVLF